VLDGCSLFARKSAYIRNENEVGDLRISFYNVPCGPVTVVGKQF